MVLLGSKKGIFGVKCVRPSASCPLLGTQLQDPWLLWWPPHFHPCLSFPLIQSSVPCHSKWLWQGSLSLCHRPAGDRRKPSPHCRAALCWVSCSHTPPSPWSSCSRVLLGSHNSWCHSHHNPCALPSRCFPAPSPVLSPADVPGEPQPAGLWAWSVPGAAVPTWGFSPAVCPLSWGGT